MGARQTSKALPNTTSPVQILGKGVDTYNILKIAVGEDFALALAEDGTVLAWGGNASGQLGLGYIGGDPVPGGAKDETYPMFELEPKAVIGLDGLDIIDISAGKDHALLLTADGKVYGMGSYVYGKLSPYRTTGAAPKPVYIRLPAAAQAYDIIADESTSHILTRSGDVLSYGKNPNNNQGYDQGQFGTSEVTRFGPVYAAGDAHSNLVAVSSGNNSVMAINSTGKVVVWGRNDMGQLGIKNVKDDNDPVAGPYVTVATEKTSFNDTVTVDTGVEIPAVAIHVSAGPTGLVSYKGYTGGTHPSGSLVAPILVQPVDNSQIVPVGQTIAQPNSGSVGSFVSSFATDMIPYNHALAASTGSGVSHLTYKSVRSAGENSHGQLGIDKDLKDSPRIFKRAAADVVLAGAANTFAPSSAIDSIIEIATSPYGNFALAYDNDFGTVYSWGANANGQLGDGTYADKKLPVAVNNNGGGSYLDISSIIVNNNAALPQYPASLSFTELPYGSVTGSGIVIDTLYGIMQPAAEVAADAGTTMRAIVDLAPGSSVESFLLRHNTTGIVETPLSVGMSSMVLNRWEATFDMPSDSVTLYVKVSSGSPTAVSTNLVNLKPGVANITANDNLGVDASGQDNKLNISDKVWLAVWNDTNGRYEEYSAANPVPMGKKVAIVLEPTTLQDYTIPASPVAVPWVAQRVTTSYTGTGSVLNGVAALELQNNVLVANSIGATSNYTVASFVMPDASPTITAYFGTTAPTARKVIVNINDNFTITPGSNLVYENSNVSGTQILSGGSFTAVPGDVVRMETVNKPGYYAVVTASALGSSGYTAVPVKVSRVPGGTAADDRIEFVMPASDEVTVDVTFRYGSSAVIRYDTIIAPDGTLSTAVNVDDEVQIIPNDIVGQLGFNAYGPSTYQPQGLTFESVNTLVATVAVSYTHLTLPTIGG